MHRALALSVATLLLASGCPPGPGGTGGGGGSAGGAGGGGGGGLDAGPDAGPLDGGPDAGGSDGGDLDGGGPDAGRVVRGRTLVGPGQSFISSSISVGPNLYVVGYFRGSVDFGTTLVSQGVERNGFVAKYDSALALQWVRQLGGADNLVSSISYDLALDDLIVAGQFNSSVSFGDGGLVGSGSLDSYVARISSAGAVTGWVHLRPTDGGSVSARGVAAGAGKLAVVGQFFLPFSTDGGAEAPPSVALASSGAGAFVAFYEPDLVPTGTTWTAAGVPSFESCRLTDVAADPAGDFYVLGEAPFQCALPSTTLGFAYPEPDVATRFVWKLLSSTSSAWAQSYGTMIAPGFDEVLLVDGPKLFISGSTHRALRTSDGGLIARLDGGALYEDGGESEYDGVLVQAEAATGIPSWAEPSQLPGFSYSRGVAVSASGSLHTLGVGGSQRGLVLTRVPEPPDLALLTGSSNVSHPTRLVPLGSLLAIAGVQNGPFTVGDVSLNPGLTDGGSSGFILLVTP